MTENTDSGEQPAASGASEGGPQPGPQGASQTFTAAPPPPQQPPHRPRPPLRRSREDRKLAGVSGGLGRYFDVDPLIFRVLFVTLAVFGGSGLLLYAIAWLFIPDEGENESELQSLVNGRGSSRIVGAIVLGVLGLIALGNFAHTGWGFGGFAALVAIGLAVYLITRGDNAWRAAPQSPAPGAPTPAQAPAPAPGAYGQTPGTAYVGTGGPVPTASGASPYTPGASSYAPDAPPYGSGGPYGPQAYATRPAPPTWTPPPPTPPEPRSPLGRITVSVALLLAGVLVTWNLATSHDVPAQVVIGSCLAVVGLGLVVGAFAGRARGLIALGIVLTIAASIAGVAQFGLRGGVGERNWSPNSAAAVREHGTYQLGVGRARLDLSQLQLSAGRPLTVTVRHGVGSQLIILPADAPARIDAQVGAGEIRVPGRDPVNGTDVDRHVLDPSGTSRSAVVITIDAKLGVGDLEVRRATA